MSCALSGFSMDGQRRERAMGVEFERDDYVFLTELGLKPENLGCYGGGVWRGNGPTATSVNPSDNKVCKFTSLFYFFFYKKNWLWISGDVCEDVLEFSLLEEELLKRNLRQLVVPGIGISDCGVVGGLSWSSRVWTSGSNFLGLVLVLNIYFNY